VSRIDELIARHCPDGVPYEILSDVAKLERGTSITQKQVTAGSIPVVAGGRTPAYFHADFNRDGESIVIAGSGAYAGFVSWWEGPIFVSDAFSISTKAETLLPKYCFHWLSSKQNILHSLKSGGGVPHVYAKDVGKLRIPVPPVEVQREIVRILDQFTQLEAELEAELEARARQYAHYRSALIGSDPETPTVSLGEIADFKYGFTAKAETTGSHRFIRITDIGANGKLSPEGAKFVSAGDAAQEYVVKAGDLLMARTGATYGKTMLFEASDPAVYASFLIRIRFNRERMLPAYYWHFAQSREYWDQANALVSRGGQPQFNANVLRLVRVPVPSLDEQARVVRLLDEFDVLANSLSVGLPAELAARRKQYEYYRDRLLTFEEAAV
jgi:type I restriction enzyme S subunit